MTEKLEGWKEVAIILIYISLYSAGGLLTKLSKGDGDYTYNPVGVTLVVSCLKLIISLAMLANQGWPANLGLAGSWRFAYPAVVYVIDDNLQFAVLYYITPGEAALFFSFKVLSTAMASKIMLNREISSLQWSALMLLTLGLGTSKIGGQHFQGFNLGHVLVVVVSTIGSTGDVYNEKLLKTDTEASIHLQNIKLYTFSVLLNGLGYAVYEKQGTLNSATYGWNVFVVMLVFVNSFNGIAVSVIFKFLDNIVKVQAAAGGMVLTVLLSSLIFGREPSLGFYLGVGIVFNALYIFNYKHKPITSDPQIEA
eukprot:TRINITY_DN10272_c0_g1_i3.p1 TRINITY_DN10272_c0_g1~~TRINITY_DN10272_c0_g1_i3.p1  ORF type:complete len:309 (+),score=60.34 TRINITY_DN10272_c0_g1_i3:35-961(+)